MKLKVPVLFILTLILILGACRRPQSDASGKSQKRDEAKSVKFYASAPANGSGGISAVVPDAVPNQPPPPQPEVSLKGVSAAAPNRMSSGCEGGIAGGVLGCVLGGAVGQPVSHRKKEGLFYRSADKLLIFEEKEIDGDIVSTGHARGNNGNGQARITQGTLRAMTPGGEDVGFFPLKHTEVTADVSGYLASTKVVQKYSNTFKEPIEAVYVFPLGSMTAVNGFVMESGGRKIVGVVKPREEAEKIYAEAVARGQTASLLTQERPNIFTQKVANIAPGEAVTITITTFEKLPYAHGAYEYVFPMVVGPRYIPGTPVKTAPDGKDNGGWSPPTNVVPDAGNITPPVLKPGERSGHDIGLTVHLDAGFPINKVESVAQKVEINNEGIGKRTIVLAKSDAIPNRDFVLRWKLKGDKFRFGVLAHRDNGNGTFTLMVRPPVKPDSSQVNPREITFILDISGSMSGLPIETSKSLVRKVLDRMRPDDTFNVFVFAGDNGQLWAKPMPNTPRNVMEAKHYLNDLRGGGGTEMLAGIKRALSGRHDPSRVQMFVFCTDGYVGDEARILRTIKEERGDARFFAFGIGNGVNRYLISSIGEYGGGRSMIVMPRDGGAASRAASRFFEFIDSPVLLDAAIDWNGLPVTGVYPSRLGDLFAGGTIDVIARYSRPAKGVAYVTGRVGSRRVRYPVYVTLPSANKAHPQLETLWARYRIHDLMGRMLSANSAGKADLKKRVTDLAVRYRLASAFTSFVAVDSSRIVGDGRPMRIIQPVEMPEGVSYEGVFGDAGTGPVYSIPAWGIRIQETTDGQLRVAEVKSGPVGKAGIRPGAAFMSVNGVTVHKASSLETLLMQSSGNRIKAVFKPGGKITLPL